MVGCEGPTSIPAMSLAVRVVHQRAILTKLVLDTISLLFRIMTGRTQTATRKNMKDPSTDISSLVFGGVRRAMVLLIPMARTNTTNASARLYGQCTDIVAEKCRCWGMKVLIVSLR